MDFMRKRVGLPSILFVSLEPASKAALNFSVYYPGTILRILVLVNDCLGMKY
ncbi:hypothetical protein BDW72DRAFT_169482 [Aspergillus terricola var. indicus]